MDEQKNETRRRMLEHVSNRELLEELVERGVLREYGISQYVPGIVRARAELTEAQFESLQRARLIADLAKQLAGTPGVVDFQAGPPASPDAPPNDTVYRAGVLTVYPEADMDACS